jgi:S-(hydroxymethyl)glutathione dehydrogenase / alcohol dehydrogenase
MKAAVFHKPGDIRVDEVDPPQIENPQDIILRVTATAICGSDLHIFNGLIPQEQSPFDKVANVLHLQLAQLVL